MRARVRACVRVRVRARACVPSAAAVAIQLQPFCHAENQLGRVVTQGTLRDNSAKLNFRMAKGLQSAESTTCGVSSTYREGVVSLPHPFDMKSHIKGIIRNEMVDRITNDI